MYINKNAIRRREEHKESMEVFNILRKSFQRIIEEERQSEEYQS